MITRTLTQVKVFDVKANGELIGGQGVLVQFLD